MQLEIAKRIELLPVAEPLPQLGIIENIPVPVLIRPTGSIDDLRIERVVMQTVQQLSLFG